MDKVKLCANPRCKDPVLTDEWQVADKIFCCAPCKVNFLINNPKYNKDYFSFNDKSNKRLAVARKVKALKAANERTKRRAASVGSTDSK